MKRHFAFASAAALALALLVALPSAAVTASYFGPDTTATAGPANYVNVTVTEGGYPSAYVRISGGKFYDGTDSLIVSNNGATTLKVATPVDGTIALYVYDEVATGVFGQTAADVLIITVKPGPVVVVDYPAPTKVWMSREPGASYVNWDLLTSAIPSILTLSEFRVTVQCSGPSYYVSEVQVSSTSRKWSDSGMALGAQCTATVRAVYRDSQNRIFYSNFVSSVAKRLVEAPTTPTVQSAGVIAGTSLRFPFGVSTTPGRETDSITVSEYRNGSLIKTTVITAATGWIYTLPLTDSMMGLTENFSAVASNSAGSAPALAWSLRLPVVAEAPTSKQVKAVTSNPVGGGERLGLNFFNDGSRPWMRDQQASYVIHTYNVVTDTDEETRLPVVGTVMIADLAPMLASTWVSVAVQTGSGESDPFWVIRGSDELYPPSFGSTRDETPNGLTLVWATNSLSGSDLVRVEVYRGTTLKKSLTTNALAGKLDIRGLEEDVPYGFAVFTSDGVDVSATALIVNGRTGKTAAPTPSPSPKPTTTSTPQPKPTPKPTPKPKPKPTTGGVTVSGKVTVKRTIVCGKGALRKKVTATKPVCPAGYKPVAK